MPSKTVNDTVHGSIEVEGVALDLLETLEIQRLNAIRQLGLTYLVFPGANHTRLEHVLGTYHVARQIASHLELSKEETLLVSIAALLHDVGHGPFSHTLERVLEQRTGLDHMEVSKRIIVGEADSVSGSERDSFPDHPRVVEVLEEWGIDPQRVADLVRGSTPMGTLPGLESRNSSPSQPYLGQIIHGVLDADQIDFLLRDALYTGVALGIIDLPRLLTTFRLHKGELVVDRKGLSAVEGTLVARGLMYTSVYFHKTVRIAETMLSRAAERGGAPLDEVRYMNDAELMAWLQSLGGYPRETALRLKYRRLYKRALTLEREELTGEELEKLKQLADPPRRLEVEEAVSRRAGLSPGEVLIDIPAPELLLTEPRIAQVDLRVLDDGRIAPFRRVSSLAKALQLRETVGWALMVACDSAHVGDVAKAASKVIFG